MFTILTGRYNNQTWNATINYRLKKNIQCIYAPPSPITESIYLNSPVFVIEMNNELNQIMGIGLIKNKAITEKVYKVHEDTNLNRYIYIGEYHLNREKIEEYNPLLVNILDQILFKGKTHSKRGSGLTKIPEKVLKLEICEGMDIKKEIRNLFIFNFREDLRENIN